MSEQPLGGEEGGGGLAEGGALLLGQREGRDDAEPVDEAVGDLGGDDLLLQAVGEDRVAVPLLHRRREGGAAARASSVGSSVNLAASIAACSRILAVESRTASSGRVRPRFCLGAAEQLLVAVEPLDRAVELAALLEDLDHPDELRQRPRAAALGDRQRQRLQAVVLEHERADLVGHLGEQQRCAPRSSSRPSVISRFSGILMLTSLSEQSTPALIVDEVGVDPAAMLGELDPRRPG